MPYRLSRRLFAGTVACLAALGVSAANAADWKPDRPVTMIVPYSPGGGTDAQARAVARELQRVWGQTVIVENVPGADGLIGTRKVIESKPDGYTLLVQLPSLTLLKHLPQFKGTDPMTQLAPISLFGALAGVVAVNASLPVKNMAELIRYCKTATQPCSLGTTENIARLQARMLSVESDVPNLIVANYKGGGQLITDLVGNNINMGLMGMTAVLPHYKSGSLKVLMTFGHKRSSVAPEVPHAVEAGFPSFDSITWYGLFAPKETPPAILQGVAAAVREAVKGEEVRRAFAVIGSDAVANTPAEFAKLVQDESDRYGALAKRFPIE